MTNQIETHRFGPIEFVQQETLFFPKGIPGFDGLRRFILIQGDDYQPFKFLQSVEDPAISFPLLSPALVRPDYQLELTGEQLSELDLERAKKALVFCVVTIAEDPGRVTANLFAPLVINPDSRVAAQIMLSGSDYPVDEVFLEAR